MILGFVYWGLFSFFQVNVYGWGLMITYGFLLIPYWKSITYFDNGQNKKSLLLLAIVSGIILIFIWVRVQHPQYFKELGIDNNIKNCQPFEYFLI